MFFERKKVALGSIFRFWICLLLTGCLYINMAGNVIRGVAKSYAKEMLMRTSGHDL